MDEIKADFARHLASIGHAIGATRSAVLDQLRQTMGEDRYRRILGTKQNIPQSVETQEEFYEQFGDLAEASLFRSCDRDATLDASYSLYRQALPTLSRGTRVLELGCWTGGLASFIAQLHPNCSVTGVDLASRIMKACNDYYTLPNLRFIAWNYRVGRPEEIESADVLLCALGIVHPPSTNSLLTDVGNVRQSAEYARQSAHATGYFTSWRSAANAGATLYAIIRLRSFPKFLSWIDAAQKAGWTWRWDRLWYARLTGEGVALPGLLFEATESALLPEDEVLERWTRFTRGDDVYALFKGGEALSVYRTFSLKTVIGKREHQHEDERTLDEVALVGATAYVFTQNSKFQFRLLLVSHDRARKLAKRMAVKGCTGHITDDGDVYDAVGVFHGSPQFFSEATE